MTKSFVVVVVVVGSFAAATTSTRRCGRWRRRRPPSTAAPSPTASRCSRPRPSSTNAPTRTCSSPTRRCQVLHRLVHFLFGNAVFLDRVAFIGVDRLRVVPRGERGHVVHQGAVSGVHEGGLRLPRRPAAAARRLAGGLLARPAQRHADARDHPARLQSQVLLQPRPVALRPQQQQQQQQPPPPPLTPPPRPKPTNHEPSVSSASSRLSILFSLSLSTRR